MKITNGIRKLFPSLIIAMALTLSSCGGLKVLSTDPATVAEGCKELKPLNEPTRTMANIKGPISALAFVAGIPADIIAFADGATDVAFSQADAIRAKCKNV